MTFGGILGLWFVFFGAGSVLMARTRVPASAPVIAFLITFSIAAAFVFCTLWWMAFGPLSYIGIAALSTVLLVAALLLSPRKDQETSVSVATFILSGLVFVAMAWVLLSDQRQLFAFDTWDAVVSWNRWAEELLRGEFEPFKSPYPILWPTLWSIVYSAQGTEFMQIWTKNAHLIIIVITVLIAWALGRQRSALAALTFLAAFLFSSQELLSQFTHGYMDEPVALLIAAAIVAFFLHDDDAPLSTEQKLIWLLPYWLIGLAAVTKQAGWPVLVLGAILLAYDYWKGTASKRLLVAALIGLFAPIIVFFMLYTSVTMARPPQGGALDHFVGLSATRTGIESDFERGLSWLFKMESASDVIRLLSVSVMLLGLFFLKGRARLTVLLTALLVVSGSIGTGVCCSYDDRNSKWLYALSIAGLTGVLSAVNVRSALDKLVKNGTLSGRLSIVKAGLEKPLAKIDNRALFALLPFILVSTSVLERGADPLLRRSAEEMQNLGGYTSAVALKNELLKSEHCAAVFTAFPLVKHNPILADYRDSIRPGRDLNWFLHSPRAISPNCRTFWYFKPGIYPQASQADKEIFLARLEDGTIVHIEGYAYKVPGKFD